MGWGREPHALLLGRLLHGRLQRRMRMLLLEVMLLLQLLLLLLLLLYLLLLEHLLLLLLQHLLLMELMLLQQLLLRDHTGRPVRVWAGPVSQGQLHTLRPWGLGSAVRRIALGGWRRHDGLRSCISMGTDAPGLAGLGSGQSLAGGRTGWAMVGGLTHASDDRSHGPRGLRRGSYQ